MKQFLYFLLASFALGFYACQSDSGSAQETGIQIVQIDDNLVKLECRDISQAGHENPHNEVYVIVNDNRVKVADIEACGAVDAANYAELGIPENALIAVGGWWKGSGDFVYAEREMDRIVVKKATLTEGKSAEGIRYLTVAALSNQDLSPNPLWNKADLVGVYTYEGQNRSWIVFIGMANRDLNAMMFQTPEPLPSPENIGLVMAQATPDPLQRFQVNLMDLSFNCHLGKGRFEQRDNTLYMLFAEEKDNQGKALQLARLDLKEAQ
jgi:hypothetical protein